MVPAAKTKIAELFNKDNASNGIVILVGQLMDGDPDYFGLRNAMQTTTHSNILYINFHGKQVSLEDLNAEIRDFSQKNEKLTIISAIHGFEIFPWSEHEFLFQPQVKEGTMPLILGVDTATYLDGRYIYTEQLFNTIASAIDNKPVDFWHCSCQGNKLIDLAQRVLPKDSVFITESHGYVTRPDLLVTAVIKSLSDDSAFSIDALLLRYSFLSNHSYLSGYYRNYALNLNPVKTIIGKESVYLINKADEFLENFKNGLISNEKVNLIKSNFCNLQLLDSQKLCFDTLEKIFNSTLSTPGYDYKTASACTTHIGESSWVIHLIKCEIFGTDCYHGPYKISEKCIINDDSEYMLLVGIGAVYSSMEESNI